MKIIRPPGLYVGYVAVILAFLSALCSWAWRAKGHIQLCVPGAAEPLVRPATDVLTSWRWRLLDVGCRLGV